MLIFHILFVDNLNAEQLFCGSSYMSSLFQQHSRKSLYLYRYLGTESLYYEMADEPSDPVAHATAHECNGDREHHLACNNLSDSGASISDGATEKNNCSEFRAQQYAILI